jgi:hypothetical protein
MRIIYNKDINGHKEYQESQFELYNSGVLNFKKCEVTLKMIEEYTKFFIRNNKEFIAVKPANKPYPILMAYYKHIKQYGAFVDTENKIILLKGE